MTRRECGHAAADNQVNGLHLFHTYLARYPSCKEETGLEITGIHEYIGSFDYTSASGKKSRQFTFAVSVAQPEPVELHEHDAYLWRSLEDELPVTDAVKEVFRKYRQLRAANRSARVGGGDSDRRDNQVGAAQPAAVQSGQRVAGGGLSGHQ